MAASQLADLPNQHYMSAEALSLRWFGGVGYKGKLVSGLIEDCELNSQNDWVAILQAAAALRPWTPGWLDVDCWMWHVFPIAKHNQWTASEAERFVLQKCGRAPGRHDKNGFAQHFREIGLRFAGVRRRESVPLADFALSLDTATDRHSRGVEIPLVHLM